MWPCLQIEGNGQFHQELSFRPKLLLTLAEWTSPWLCGWLHDSRSGSKEAPGSHCKVSFVFPWPFNTFIYQKLECSSFIQAVLSTNASSPRLCLFKRGSLTPECLKNLPWLRGLHEGNVKMDFLVWKHAFRSHGCCKYSLLILQAHPRKNDCGLSTPSNSKWGVWKWAERLKAEYWAGNILHSKNVHEIVMLHKS